MNRKLATGGLLTVALLAATGLAFAAGSASVQVSLEPSVTTVAADGSLTYTARFGCSSSVADCAAATLKVDIPAPLQIVGSPLIGGFITKGSKSGNTVSFQLTDPLTAGSSGSVTINVKAPSCNPIGTPTPGPLVANATMAATGATGNAAAVAITVSPFADCAPPPSPPVAPGPPGPPGPPTPTGPFKKTGTDAMIGGLNSWSIKAPAEAAAYSIEDVLPAGLVVHDLGANSGLAISVDCGSGYVPVSGNLLSMKPQPAGCALPGQDLSQYRYQNLAKIRLDVAANTSGTLWIRTFVGSPILPGTFVENCAVKTDLAITASCAKVAVSPAAAVPETQTDLIGAPNIALAPPSGWLNPSPVSNSGSTKLSPRDIAYAIRVVNRREAGADLVDPVITQLLDANLDYTFSVAGNWWTSDAAVSVDGAAPAAFDPRLQPGCVTPLFEVIPNASGPRTLLRWTFKGCTLHGGWSGVSSVGVYVSARLKPSVTPGMQVTSDSTSSSFDPTSGVSAYDMAECNPDVPDTGDFDGDGFKTDRLCGGDSVSWKMPQGAEALSATATVQGASDGAPAVYPATATTDLTGAVSYSFVLTNSGSSPLSRLDLVDILPSVGDMTVAAPGEPRLSEWSQELIGIDGVQREDAYGVMTPVPASQYTIGLSASRNPCRWDSTAGNQVRASGGVFVSVGTVNGPDGCVPNTWAASTATPAVSFGLVYQPATLLLPGEKLHLSLRTRLNGVAPAPKATPLESWNSIAYTATLTGLKGPFTLLTGEPLKVGVRFADPSYTASIGGLVWKDFNANGIRDDGPAAGLQGIAVSVFDSAGAIVTTVLTDANGVYQLAGLIPNANYRMEISLDPGDGTLDGYFVSPANAGPDPLLNSHATQTATRAVIAGRTGAAGTVDMHNNVGAAKNNPPT
jgi:SdrD B-like domain